MTRFAEHLADAWAELWSADDDRATAMIYSRSVEWWDVRRGRAAVASGQGALLIERGALRGRVDRFALDVRRVVPGDSAVAVEFVAVASECGAPVAAPGCALWHLDDDGRIAREEWYWNWALRGPADPAVAGHDARGAGEDRGPGWYRAFVAQLYATWDASPPDVVDTFYADQVVLDVMGDGPDGVQRGAAAVRAAQADAARDGVGRETTVGEVVGRGPVVACTAFTVLTPDGDGPRRTAASARVLTLDGRDRIVSDHAYLLPPWPAAGRR